MTMLAEVTEQTLYRPVPGYDDLYAGMDATIVHAVKGELEPRLVDKNYPNGYLRVNVPGYSGMQPVHWLVAAAFLGPKPKTDRPRGIHVCHSDSNKQNNGPGNLYYGTPKQNVHDAIVNGSHGAVTHSLKTHCAQNHPLSGDNLYEVPGGRGWRQCRTCRAQRMREQGDRKRGDQPSNEQKRMMVDDLLRSDITRSGYSIAKELNVSNTMVERRRKMMKGIPL